MCVFRSARHIYVQVIDDVAGRTIVSASSMSAEMKGHSGGNAAGAREVGRLIGERAKEAGIVRVVFDRNGHLYHGRVAALADAARETGLQF
jgi:large subunit ribosomal protein L18